MNEAAIEKFKSETQYLVEGFWSLLYLWKETSDESTDSSEILKKRYKWVQKNPGKMQTIGHLELKNGEKHPVCIIMQWYEIDGVYICFYEAISCVVDHRMVEEFLKKEFPNVGITNMMNFHHALHHIDDINKK